MISRKFIATSFHCTRRLGETLPCDLSDEKTVAVLGQQYVDEKLLHLYNTIPIVDVKYPENAGFYVGNFDSHDFAIYILKYPAKFSRTIQPICLPEPMEEFYGKDAVVAGWGRYTTPLFSNSQSKPLRSVKLKVDLKRYKHFNFFGTKLEKNKAGLIKDACSGDSGLFSFRQILC